MRKVTVLAMVLIVASAAHAQVKTFKNLKPATNSANCNLDVLEFDCAQSLARGVAGVCTITYQNQGAACAGNLFSAVGIVAGGTVDQPADVSKLGLRCTVESNVQLPLSDQSGIKQLEGAAVCRGTVQLQPQQVFTFSGRITPLVNAPDPAQIVGAIVIDDGQSGTDLVALGEVPLAGCIPVASAPPLVRAGGNYSIVWTPTSSGGPYEIQEATKSDFSDAATITTQNLQQNYQHGTEGTYFYRVRASRCAGTVGAYSTTVQTVVVAPQAPTSRSFDIPVPFGSGQQVTQSVIVTGPPNTPFAATSDYTFLTVAPSTGTTDSNGKATLTVTGDSLNLPAGANTSSIKVTFGAAGKGLGNDATSSTTVPVSISLVTPVVPASRTTPSAESLVIPAVAHLVGAGNIPFQSDVRIANSGNSAATYLLTFTPSNTDGTTTGKQTTVPVAANQTVALNDVLKNFFGFGAPGDAVGGTLEIRPLSGSANSTFASSRTYATGATGTYGQFIPSVPAVQFLSKGATPALSTLTLTQISQGASFRTNVGLVEGLGQPASGRIRIYDGNGILLTPEFGFSLRPFESQQLNGLLASKGITADNARVEVIIDSSTGAVTTYASVVDNNTTDPLLVTPILPTVPASTRYVLPGMADLNNGAANFHSDVRIFNPSAVTVTATATYYPQTNPGGAVTKTLQLLPGSIQSYENILPTVFGVGSTGGQITLQVPGTAALIVSGRTYSRAATAGTYGQFIPAVTPPEGIGNGETLELLQLEQSANFRSNVGLSELSGNPVSVKVSVISPGAKVTPVVNIDLQANEFRQLNAVIASLFPGVDTYNARAVIQVIGGTGRLTAYGSVIDNATQDPTYVPAQR